MKRIFEKLYCALFYIVSAYFTASLFMGLSETTSSKIAMVTIAVCLEWAKPKLFFMAKYNEKILRSARKKRMEVMRKFKLYSCAIIIMGFSAFASLSWIVKEDAQRNSFAITSNNETRTLNLKKENLYKDIADLESLKDNVKLTNDDRRSHLIKQIMKKRSEVNDIDDKIANVLKVRETSSKGGYYEIFVTLTEMLGVPLSFITIGFYGFVAIFFEIIAMVFLVDLLKYKKKENSNGIFSRFVEV
ncbi:MAG: hypothetical protein ACRC0V_06625 [Fusobacteriaceae bacterium]